MKAFVKWYLENGWVVTCAWGAFFGWLSLVKRKPWIVYAWIVFVAIVGIVMNLVR